MSEVRFGMGFRLSTDSPLPAYPFLFWYFLQATLWSWVVVKELLFCVLIKALSYIPYPFSSSHFAWSLMPHNFNPLSTSAFHYPFPLHGWFLLDPTSISFTRFTSIGIRVPTCIIFHRFLPSYLFILSYFSLILYYRRGVV